MRTIEQLINTFWKDRDISELWKEEIKIFLFQTIIPEILNNILDIRTDEYNEIDWENFPQNFSLWCRIWVLRIKQKAKELYNINL